MVWEGAMVVIAMARKLTRRPQDRWRAEARQRSRDLAVEHGRNVIHDRCP